MNPVLQQSREWLIQPDALRSMAAASRSFLERGAALPQPGQSSPLLSVDDGIGVVAIDGPILRKPDIFARVLFRATDSNMIGDALREAGARDDIKAVFLDIDSPGGTVAGTPELAATVASINERKPVYAFSSGLMASAAYWIASQARAIYATPSAQVGSIGVVQAVIDDREAELIKYGANAFLYLKVVYANILHDLARGLGCNYARVSDMVAADARIGPSHLQIADNGGRGAGGHCFIKDFEAFIGLYAKAADDPTGLVALEAWRDKNVQLLRDSGKNPDLLRGVYGET